MTMDNVLPEPIQGWLDRTPKAKRAYERIRADLDSVAAWVETTTRGELRDKAAAIIDPPASAAAGQSDSRHPRRPGLTQPSVTNPKARRQQRHRRVTAGAMATAARRSLASACHRAADPGGLH